ncbi:hypothetical protein H2203_001847 [Taxawa tesnikishii (nom. ined.)]|nr:hypothetical protein H2203_001847 [Dothideales sp. JES 119]
MHDERPTDRLPFVTLPKAPTLPHNYTSLPSTLPPSSISASAADDGQPPAYVTSSSGFAAHPSAIIAQNRALLEQLAKSARDAEHAVTRWEAGIRERELAEKRRKAPGWLDREEKILEPERAAQATGGGEGVQEARRSSATDRPRSATC